MSRKPTAASTSASASTSRRSPSCSRLRRRRAGSVDVDPEKLDRICDGLSDEWARAAAAGAWRARRRLRRGSVPYRERGSDRAPAARAGAHLNARDDHALTGLVAHEKAEETPHRRSHRIGAAVGRNDPSDDEGARFGRRPTESCERTHRQRAGDGGCGSPATGSLADENVTAVIAPLLAQAG